MLPLLLCLVKQSGTGITEQYSGATLSVAAGNLQQITYATSTHVGYTNTSQVRGPPNRRNPPNDING